MLMIPNLRCEPASFRSLSPFLGRGRHDACSALWEWKNIYIGGTVYGFHLVCCQRISSQRHCCRGASMVARDLGCIGLGVGGYAARGETTENSLKSRNSSTSGLSNSENS